MYNIIIIRTMFYSLQPAFCCLHNYNNYTIAIRKGPCGTTVRRSSKMNYAAILIIIQVNEKFHKLERGYRDCIKRTRDKTRIYSIPHDAPGA